MKFKKPGDELSKLLGTPDREQQVERVKRLLAAPVVDVIIRVDGRADQVTAINVVGGQMSPDVFYRVLDQARDMMRRQELQALAQQNGHATSPPLEKPAEEKPPDEEAVAEEAH